MGMWKSGFIWNLDSGMLRHKNVQQRQVALSECPVLGRRWYPHYGFDSARSGWPAAAQLLELRTRKLSGNPRNFRLCGIGWLAGWLSLQNSSLRGCLGLGLFNLLWKPRLAATAT